MAQPERTFAGSGTPGADAHAADLAAVGGRAVPPAVVEEVDSLFLDADQHGPRARALTIRVAPLLVLLPITVAAAMQPTLRTWLFGEFGTDAANTLLVAPLLVIVVLLAGAMAPLARASTVHLFAAGAALLGIGSVAVFGGWLVAAAVPSAIGTVLVGLGTARAVRRAVWVLPLLLAAGLSDVRSVQGGYTRDLLDAAAPAGGGAPAELLLGIQGQVQASSITQLDYVVLHLPAASGLWLFGLVDVIAIAMLLGLTHLYWRPVAISMLAFVFVVAATTSATSPIPVLPLLGIVWSIVNAPLIWRSTRFTIRRLMYLGG